jgi:phenylacetate-CoA ligase
MSRLAVKEPYRPKAWTSQGFYVRGIETSPRGALQAHQVGQLRRLLAHTYANNVFYRKKYAAAGFTSCGDVVNAAGSTPSFRELPLTTKAELLEDQAAYPPYGSNLACFPVEFVRQHQTSGTTGTPLKVWETRQSWHWMTRLWLFQFHALNITPSDVVFMAFNFSHGLGLWNVLDAGMQVGALTLTGGGLSSLQRVEAITSNGATVLVCTPSYALRLASVAAEHRIDIRESAVRMIVAAGEPGASLPAVRARIEDLWGARLYDSPGATEVGHFGMACTRYGVHAIEGEFYVEMIDPNTLQPVPPGQAGEIVVTNFGRPSSPVIRYRTGDIAKALYDRCECGRTMMRFDGGIIGRSDDMFVVRGVNVFPSAIEAIIRESGNVTEYAAEVFEDRGMYGLRVQVEMSPGTAASVDDVIARIKDALHRRLFLKADVKVVPPNTLPRFDGKARRVIRTSLDARSNP